MSLSKDPPMALEVEEFAFPGFDTGDASEGITDFSFPGFDADGPRERVTEFRFQPFDYREAGLEPTPEELEEAKGIVGEARKKAQHIERLAYEDGFQQGQKDGREVGERSLDQQVQQFRGLVAAMAREKEELFRQREKELLELVLLISRKIVVRELKLQPEAISDIVAGGFAILADTENIRLRLNPQDHEILHWASQETWPPGVELVADGTVSPGGFVMETANCDIDGTLKSRWAAVAKVVQEALQVENGRSGID